MITCFPCLVKEEVALLLPGTPGRTGICPSGGYNVTYDVRQNDSLALVAKACGTNTTISNTEDRGVFTPGEVAKWKSSSVSPGDRVMILLSSRDLVSGSGVEI